MDEDFRLREGELKSFIFEVQLRRLCIWLYGIGKGRSIDNLSLLKRTSNFFGIYFNLFRYLKGIFFMPKRIEMVSFRYQKHLRYLYRTLQILRTQLKTAKLSYLTGVSLMKWIHPSQIISWVMHLRKITLIMKFHPHFSQHMQKYSSRPKSRW